MRSEKKSIADEYRRMVEGADYLIVADYRGLDVPGGAVSQLKYLMETEAQAERFDRVRYWFAFYGSHTQEADNKLTIDQNKLIFDSLIKNIFIKQ